MPGVLNGSGLASECLQRRPGALAPVHPSGNVRVYWIPSVLENAAGLDLGVRMSLFSALV